MQRRPPDAARVGPIWRHVALGWLTLASLPGFLTTWAAPLAHGRSLLAEISRIAEGAASALLVLNLGLALLLVALRFRRVALLLAMLTLAAGGSLALRIHNHAAPVQADPAAPVALRVVWWNMLSSNPTPPELLVEALLKQRADVLMLGEAAPIGPLLPDLEAQYPYRLGCPESPCDMVVLSRLPMRKAWPGLDGPYQGPINWDGPARLAAFQVDTPEGPLTLEAMHLSKAWYGNTLAGETHRSRWALRRVTGPVLIMGDFNAPPWGQVMTALARDTGARIAWPAPPTWPAALGRFGIGIDHALTRGGAVLTRLAPFAGDLGSNHRGLVADVVLRPDAD